MSLRSNVVRLIERRPIPADLRERTEALRATMSRLAARPSRPVAVLLVTTSRDLPTDWSDPPEGFMASPALHPSHFLAIELGIPKEAQRLLRIATQEWNRLRPHRQHDADLLLRTRRDLRIDELRAAAYGQEAIDAEHGPPAEGEDAAMANAVGFDHGGTGEVTYRDAGGTVRRESAANWIGFTITRLASIAMREQTRRLNREGADLDEEGRLALEERLRRELRTDELKTLAFGPPPPAAHVDPFYPADRSDPVFAAYDTHQRAYAEYIGHPECGNETTNGLLGAEVKAFEALLGTPMTTPAGRLAYALAVIEHECGPLNAGNEKVRRDDPLAVAYRNLRFGELAPEAEATTPPRARALLDFAALPVFELRAGYDVAGLLADMLSAVLSQPRCWEGPHKRHNAVGRFVSAETSRMHAVMRGCRDELRGRGRLTGLEIDERFDVLAGDAIFGDDPEGLTAAFALRDADRAADRPAF